MRVIVTGSSGLLGRHVVAALEAAGHEVTGSIGSRRKRRTVTSVPISPTSIRRCG